jgi:transcriptional regulator GlxA family with amidase domain
MSDKIKMAFLIIPQVHLLDLGCLAQVFLEAKAKGLNCDIEFCATETNIKTSVGIQVGKINEFQKIKIKKDDYLIIPSRLYPDMLYEKFSPGDELLNWLRLIYSKGVTICSLSNSALLLAEAGLLNYKKCTTHWLRIETLKELVPTAKVIENILFCEDKGIITSAGALSCIDLGLYLVLKLGGGKMAYEISEKLLLYNIRHGGQEQVSVFLKYRSHTHRGIHKVQDFILDNISRGMTISHLAKLANMSERNFTRIFKKETGKTVKQFITELRIEKARQFLSIPSYSRIQVANECGLQSERHLRRLIKKGKNEQTTQL